VISQALVDPLEIRRLPILAPAHLVDARLKLVHAGEQVCQLSLDRLRRPYR